MLQIYLRNDINVELEVQVEEVTVIQNVVHIPSGHRVHGHPGYGYGVIY